MSVKISALPAAGALSGTEEVPVVQSGSTVKTTTQAIADLGGGGSGLVSKTYAELVALIGSSGLTAGAQYLITDYATVHFIVDADGTQYLGDIITGVNEPLIVTANSVNTIDKNAKSALHPEDVIYYDWNPDNWIDDLSFSDLSGTPTIITGFKGVIYFRHDTLLDNYTGYDFRNCKSRRWKTNVAAWDSGTTYAKGDFVNDGGFIYRSFEDANTNHQPASSSEFWTQLLNLSLTEFWNDNPTSTNGIPSDAAFDDFKTFSEGAGSATYELCCRSNHFEPFKDDNSDFDIAGTIINNNVFFLQDQGFFGVWLNIILAGGAYNTAAGFFQSNQLGNNCLKNQFGGANTEYNQIGNGFQNNTVGDHFSKNVLVNTFQQNSIGNSFLSNETGDFFLTNIIGDNFSQNIIGQQFQGNVIKNLFVKNLIGPNGFQNNLVNSSFQLNDIKAEAAGGIDFTSATHVYAGYNTTIFLNATPAAKLSYFDGSNVLTVVNPTD